MKYARANITLFNLHKKIEEKRPASKYKGQRALFPLYQLFSLDKPSVIGLSGLVSSSELAGKKLKKLPILETWTFIRRIRGRPGDDFSQC